MKVIDKRAERNNDWHIGDVICYWNKPDSECYSRVLTCTTIEYCPKCGRRLLSENATN